MREGMQKEQRNLGGIVVWLLLAVIILMVWSVGRSDNGKTTEMQTQCDVEKETAWQQIHTNNNCTVDDDCMIATACPFSCAVPITIYKEQSVIQIVQKYDDQCGPFRCKCYRADNAFPTCYEGKCAIGER